MPCDPYQAAQALGVLATLSTGKLWTRRRLKLEDEAAFVNSKLLEPEGRRVFAASFEQVALAIGRRVLLDKPAVKEKLERAKDEALATGLAKRIGPVFDAFIPQGAFMRLDLGATPD